MKKLYLILVATMLLIPLLSKADDEVIWETEQIDGLNTVIVSPLGNVLYNSNDSIIEVRNIDDGKLIDQMIFPNTTRLNNLSITADGRYMAISGKTKFVIIYDLFERKEVKRITTEVYARKELKDSLVVYNADNWVSSSISPDGTKITGVATADGGNMSNFVVIDIASEKTIFEQRRISYDFYHPDINSYRWKSAEYSPDGKYIVAQLDYFKDGINGPDTVYVYDANTFEIYDKVLNIYGYGSYDKMYFSSFKPIFTFHTSNHIYDLDTKEVIYKYQNPKLPATISMDNSKLFGIRNFKIYCLKTFFGTTSVKDNNKEIILFPNPTNNVVNITLDCQEPIINYQINNSEGLLIYQNKIPNSSNILQVDFSSYITGIYLLTIKCNQNQKTYKIIKEN